LAPSSARALQVLLAKGNEPGLIERIELLGLELLAVEQTSEPG
jgi:hypothetical protein